MSEAPHRNARLELAPLPRRILSLIYEALLLTALLWCAALPYALVEQKAAVQHVRWIQQVYLVLVAGVYFVWHWRKGQTLPMKTWRMRLVTYTGEGVELTRAAARYFAAVFGLALVGLGWFWAFFDRDQQFLHDRLARTRLVRS